MADAPYVIEITAKVTEGTGYNSEVTASSNRSYTAKMGLVELDERFAEMMGAVSSDVHFAVVGKGAEQTAQMQATRLVD